MIHRSFLSGIKLAHRRVQRCSMAELQSTTSPVALPAEVPELSSSIQSLATILPAEKTFASSVSHSRKRSPGPDLTVPDRRKSKKRRNDQPNEIHLEHLPDTRYYFEHGLRKVEPYHYTWTCYAKGRWLGRTIEEVFREEFLSINEEISEARLNANPSNIFVNGIRVEKTHKIKNSDYIAHYMHRHEMPVTEQPIRIIAETDDMLVVDKPASIPVHPCGRFNMNSVASILASEFGRKDLRIAHRLDRLTSGLLIFTKHFAASQGIQEQMADRAVKKEYIARVAGAFPTDQVVCSEPIDCVNLRAGIYQVRPTGKHAVTLFDRLSYDAPSNTSIVHCKPRTGRTHQIRVHLQYIGFPIANDPFYGPNSTFTGGDSTKYTKDECLSDEFGVECQKMKFGKYAALPDKPWIDEKCPECWIDFADPLPEDMRIDLHAWKYEGPGWSFVTDPPFWAKDVQVPLKCEPEQETTEPEATAVVETAVGGTTFRS